MMPPNALLPRVLPAWRRRCCHRRCRTRPLNCAVPPLLQVAAAAFDLLFAFDEVISLGHKENVTVAQVCAGRDQQDGGWEQGMHGAGSLDGGGGNALAARTASPACLPVLACAGAAEHRDGVT